MSQQEIEKLERTLSKHKENLIFAQKQGNRQRQRYYQGLITNTEKQIKETKRDESVEINAHLHSVVDGLKREIIELEETEKKTKEVIEIEKDEINKILHPEKYLNPEPKSEPELEPVVDPIPETEPMPELIPVPEPETEEPEKIECKKCGKMINEKGMPTHLSRWCKGEV